MAVTVRELYDGTRRSAGNVRYNSGVRRFSVEVTAGEFTRENIALATGLPVLGSLFYFNNKALSAVQYRVEETDSPTTYIVEFEYDDVEFEKQESSAIEPQQESYPFYLPENYIATVTQLSQPQTKLKWVLRQMTFENYYTQLVVTLFLRQWTKAERESVIRQCGKIHRFQERDWLFKGCNADREGPERYRVVYRWISDPGFDPTGLMEFLNSTYVIPRHASNFSDIIRHPFETYLAGPATSIDDDPGTPGDERVPRMYIVEPRNRDDTGYLLLPGIPIQ